MKKLIFVIAILFTSNAVSSQSLFQTVITLTDSLYIYSDQKVYETPAGNFKIYGNISTNPSRYYLMDMDSNGNVISSKSIGRASTALYRMHTLPTGTAMFGDSKLLAFHDTAGNLLGANIYDAGSVTNLNCRFGTPNSKFILHGAHRNPNRAVVAEVDTVGNLIGGSEFLVNGWPAQLNYAIHRRNNHNLFSGWVSDAFFNSTFSGLAILETDSALNGIWATQIGDTSWWMTSGGQVVEFADSSLMVFCEATEVSTQDYKIIIVKLSKNGQLIWSKLFTSIFNLHVNEVVQSGDYSAILYANRTGPGSHICEFDSGGSVLRSFWFTNPINSIFSGKNILKLNNGGYLFDGGTSVNFQNLGSYYVKTDSLFTTYCGKINYSIQTQPITLLDSMGFQQFPSTISVTPVPLTDFDTRQEISHQFNPCDPTTIEEHQSILSNIQVAYSMDHLKLMFGSTINATTDVFLYDGTGKLILKKVIQTVQGKNDIVLDVPDLSSGIYLTGFRIQNETNFVKLMVSQ